MTQNELLNKILALVPNAKVSIHELSNRKNADDGISSLYEINGFLVVWNSTNEFPCPPEEEIND
jgi:hypothetical protein